MRCFPRSHLRRRHKLCGYARRAERCISHGPCAELERSCEDFGAVDPISDFECFSCGIDYDKTWFDFLCFLLEAEVLDAVGESERFRVEIKVARRAPLREPGHRFCGICRCVGVAALGKAADKFDLTVFHGEIEDGSGAVNGEGAECEIASADRVGDIERQEGLACLGLAS